MIKKEDFLEHLSTVVAEIFGSPAEIVAADCTRERQADMKEDPYRMAAYFVPGKRETITIVIELEHPV